MKSIIILLLALMGLLTDVVEKLNLLFTDAITHFTLIYKAIVIAIFGGTVDYIAQVRKTSEPLSFKKYIFNVAIAGFAGLLTINLCTYFSVDSQLSSFLTGISGYAGVRALSFFEDLTKLIVNKMTQLRFVNSVEPLKNNGETTSQDLPSTPKIEVSGEQNEGHQETKE